MLEHGKLAKHFSVVKGRGPYCYFATHDFCWGPETVRITKVKGHASEADVPQGRVRAEDRLGKMEAGTATD